MARRDADDAFDQFAAAAWPRLRWTAYLLTGDGHLAEDLAQTALERTYASWSRVRRDDALAYARKVLVNTNVDRLRRRRLTEVSDVGLDLATPPAGNVSDDRDEIVRLLARLSDRERRIVVLRHYYDLTEKAVAAELGISVGTVKSTTSKALAKLRADEHLTTRGVS